MPPYFWTMTMTAGGGLTKGGVGGRDYFVLCVRGWEVYGIFS